jgi:hypothetical protein
VIFLEFLRNFLEFGKREGVLGILKKYYVFLLEKSFFLRYFRNILGISDFYFLNSGVVGIFQEFQ